MVKRKNLITNHFRKLSSAGLAGDDSLPVQGGAGDGVGGENEALPRAHAKTIDVLAEGGEVGKTEQTGRNSVVGRTQTADGNLADTGQVYRQQVGKSVQWENCK